MSYVVGKCLFSLCSHFHTIKKTWHRPVPTHEAIIANVREYLIPAKDFIKAVEAHNPSSILFVARSGSLKMLLNEGNLPNALVPTESGVDSGREESQAAYLRMVQAAREDMDVGESGETPAMDDGESGDEGGKGSEVIKKDSHKHAQVDARGKCNVLNVMDGVDTITAMHVGRGAMAGTSRSEVWLTEECNMAPVKESLNVLRLAINNPTTFQLDNVKDNVEELLGKHKIATSEVIR
jgi:hypothetical protein